MSIDVGKRASAAAAVVGMVGDGQLARMTHQAAVDLGVELVVLGRAERASATDAGARAILGDPRSAEALRSLARASDVVTFDHEGVPAELAIRLAEEGHLVRPAGEALRLAQDKLLARQVFGAAGYAVPAFAALGDDPVAEVAAFSADHGWPVVCKARTGGYDGRGVEVVSGPDDVAAAIRRLGGSALMVEAHVDLVQELAVVGVRSPSGAWAAYPVVATFQVDGICNELVLPAPVSPALAERAERVARSIAEGAGATGVFVVELFLTSTGELVLNEVALRPHNAGHATIEAAVTSQFHNHLRAVLDWPLGGTGLRAPAAAMVNVVGGASGGDPRKNLPRALSVRDASVHLYAKSPSPGRKLGHVTALGPTTDAALETARQAAALLHGG